MCCTSRREKGENERRQVIEEEGKGGRVRVGGKGVKI